MPVALTSDLFQSHRFRPAGPLGLPHEMVKDEVINGMLYPKGAIVFMNMCQDIYRATY